MTKTFMRDITIALVQTELFNVMFAAHATLIRDPAAKYVARSWDGVGGYMLYMYIQRS